MSDYSAMAFPKESWKTGKKKKRRRRHRKSIMHSKESGFCYLCALLNNDYSYKQTEEHHVVFGSGQRELSEEYGLKVYLCREHHREGKMAPHNNKEIEEMLCRLAQQAFMAEYLEIKWEDVFKKNYL